MWRSVIASKSRRFVALWTLPAVAVFAAACRNDDSPRTPLSEMRAGSTALPDGHPPLNAGPTLPTVARAALDSGNTAYRAKNYGGALRFYRAAAQAAPTHASPWFGIYMVAQATKNTALADSARKEVQKRTVDAPGVADSTLRSAHPSAPEARKS